MFAPIFKWLFIQYNRGALKNKLFDGELSVEGLHYPVTIYRDQSSIPHIYLLVSGSKPKEHGLLLAEEIRDKAPFIKILTNCGEGSLKSQFKKADKSGAEIALILGEDELEKKQLTVKYLREEKPQITVKWNEITSFLNKTLLN